MKAHNLTPRQVQIARLIAGEGLSNKAVAGRLFITEGTVKVYLSGMFKTLNIDSRLQLALWAKGAGQTVCFPDEIGAGI